MFQLDEIWEDSDLQLKSNGIYTAQLFTSGSKFCLVRVRVRVTDDVIMVR